MGCSTLQSFLEGNLQPEEHARFEQHCVGCAACRDEVEASMQLYALGALLAQRPDRPHAIIPERRPAAHRWRRYVPGGAALTAAAFAVIMLWHGRSTETLEGQITAGLMPSRVIVERLPYAAFDRYREYDPTRSGSPRREQVSARALADLEALPDKTGLIAAHLARGDLDAAEQVLSGAGPGDDLDVERAIVAYKKGHHTVALALLDEVLARAPRHAQAMWNRAVVLAELDLPLVAAEAFEASADVFAPFWYAEAMKRSGDLRYRERMRAREWKLASEACGALATGVVPDLGIARRHASVCRPGLIEAVRRAQTRDEVMRLLPVAEVIDAGSEDTASSELVQRTASLDFKIRGAAVAIYRNLTMSSNLSADDKAGLLARLRASGQSDLVLGALPRAGMLHDHIDEYVKLALTSRDPYFAEIAVERAAEAKVASGRLLEAELSLREAVERCAKQAVELRCSYLQKALAGLYVARHRPTEATETALAALKRSRRLGLYWDERFLFGILADAARFARDYSQMRAYIREAALRDDECAQRRLSHEVVAEVELAELRFASSRTELDRAPTCNQPLSLLRAEIEAELARFDRTPERTVELREAFDRIRRDGKLSQGQQAYLDATEGRLVATGDPTAARALLARAIEAADKLGIDNAFGMKARSVGYNTLLLLGAKDLDGARLLELFAAAGRAQPRAGCALGALIDDERLLLVARDASGRIQQVFEPHAFKSPDFHARTLVPVELVSALSGCSRVDVIALPPLYGQPRLLPPELAWSYRGPAAARLPVGTRRPVALTIEDVRPPEALGLPKLQSSSHQPRGPGIDEVVLSGSEATPRRVSRELTFADLVEVNAHGFVDLGISDVSLIALSPEADGDFALTARSIAALKLQRAPFIALAACQTAYTAPYLHEPWSLPYAFLLAGARGVLAPTTSIPDQDAGNFFRAVGDQVLRGVDPAAVLRDQRLSRRGGAADWVDDVVLFD